MHFILVVVKILQLQLEPLKNATRKYANKQNHTNLGPLLREYWKKMRVRVTFDGRKKRITVLDSATWEEFIDQLCGHFQIPLGTELQLQNGVYWDINLKE